MTVRIYAHYTCDAPGDGCGNSVDVPVLPGRRVIDPQGWRRVSIGAIGPLDRSDASSMFVLFCPDCWGVLVSAAEKTKECSG